MNMMGSWYDHCSLFFVFVYQVTVFSAPNYGTEFNSGGYIRITGTSGHCLTGMGVEKRLSIGEKGKTIGKAVSSNDVMFKIRNDVDKVKNGKDEVICGSDVEKKNGYGYVIKCFQFDGVDSPPAKQYYKPKTCAIM
jgi:hypothetical protein